MVLAARLLSGLGLFVASLASGWWCGRRGWLPEPRAAAVIRLVVTRLSPVVLCLSFWGREALTPRLALLPLIGLAVALSTLLPAWAYARMAQLTRPQTGSFLTCAMFSNVGYFGALIAFALYGEAAYSLAVIHLLFFSPSFYTVGLTLATRYGSSPGGASASLFSDELRIYPVIGLGLGCLLSLARVPRPEALGALNHALIPLDTALYVAAVASQVRWSLARPWVGPMAAMSAIKFVYSPLIAWALVSWAGLSGLPRLVVLLQSAMPVGVSPLMLPTLFGLDKRLAHTLWIVTTAVAVVWLLIYLPILASL